METTWLDVVRTVTMILFFAIVARWCSSGTAWSKKAKQVTISEEDTAKPKHAKNKRQQVKQRAAVPGKPSAQGKARKTSAAAEFVPSEPSEIESYLLPESDTKSETAASFGSTRSPDDCSCEDVTSEAPPFGSEFDFAVDQPFGEELPFQFFNGPHVSFSEGEHVFEPISPDTGPMQLYTDGVQVFALAKIPADCFDQLPKGTVTLTSASSSDGGVDICSNDDSCDIQRSISLASTKAPSDN
eukprot:TRINITY_DN4481_c0_g1_i1.p1 TRINITY_DN4481_c0_g1~~TRINITY_DN4481_c0_g1_i1.p1  ORF type:complete len:242 (-),score=50.23 TRINITY_DN4481_c0_g1_i1:130-855(-)